MDPDFDTEEHVVISDMEFKRIHSEHDLAIAERDFNRGQAQALAAEIERLRADNEWLRGAIRNSIAAQDWNIAKRALLGDEQTRDAVK